MLLLLDPMIIGGQSSGGDALGRCVVTSAAICGCGGSAPVPQLNTVNSPDMTSDGGCGDGPRLAEQVALSSWPAVVETPESKAALALSSFSFKPSVPCSGAPMDPQLQVGGAGQMSALSWPIKTAGSEPDSHSGRHSKGEDTESDSSQSSLSWCHSNQTDCDTDNDTDDLDAERATRLRRRRQTRAVRQWKRQRAEAAKERERAAEIVAAAEARAKAAAKEREVSLLVSQSRALAANIYRFVKPALKAVNKETREEARLLYANAGRRALQLYATRNTNLNPVIASLRRARLLLLKFLRRPDSAAKTDQAANSPAPSSEATASNQKDSLEEPLMRKRLTTIASVTPESPTEQLPRVKNEVVGEQALELRGCAVLGTSDLHLHVCPASEAHSSPSVSVGGELFSAQDDVSRIAATAIPAPVAVTSVFGASGVVAATSALSTPGGSGVANPPLRPLTLPAQLTRSFGFEGWSGVERTPDKIFADGRTVGGGQDVNGSVSLPVEGGRGGREFRLFGWKLLAFTLALPGH